MIDIEKSKFYDIKLLLEIVVQIKLNMFINGRKRHLMIPINKLLLVNLDLKYLKMKENSIEFNYGI